VTDFVDKPSFCVLPWIHRVFDTDGKVRVCCNYPENHGMIEDWQKGWNDDYIRGLRKTMIDGGPTPLCGICAFNEVNGRVSDRQKYNTKFMPNPTIRQLVEDSINNDYTVTTPPRFVEFRFGSLCNLKCKMCSGHYSSTIREDSAQLKKLDPEGYAKHLPVEDQYVDLPEDWFTKPECIARVDELLPYITEMHFAGGEPTMMPEYRSILQRCVDMGVAGSILVSLSTNGTNINPELIRLMRQFGKVCVTFSLDGVGPSYEYIRVPANWAKVRENFSKIVEQLKSGGMQTGVHMVVQLCNMLYITDAIDEFVEIAQLRGDSPGWPSHIKLTSIQWPRLFRLDKAPKEIRDLALARYLAWKSTADMELVMKHIEPSSLEMLEQQLTADVPRHSYKSIVEYVRFIDQNKKQKLSVKIPELYKLLMEGLIAEAQATVG
jgi:pyruvate-formate lyase-activating enzyme